MESYKGLIFGNWDTSAPGLRDYLGDIAWYLDGMLDRREGGTEIVGGVQKVGDQLQLEIPGRAVRQ